jgi:hypothetical protein
MLLVIVAVQTVSTGPLRTRALREPFQAEAEMTFLGLDAARNKTWVFG